ncbi:MAG: ArdC family protein, partial [Gammaproteobacteria bacterium]
MLSIQKQITNEIINALKEGVKPWVCPWNVAGQNKLPANFATGVHYSGINIAILWSECYRNNYSSADWLTFNQVKKLNGTIIKGSKG